MGAAPHKLIAAPIAVTIANAAAVSDRSLSSVRTRPVRNKLRPTRKVPNVVRMAIVAITNPIIVAATCAIKLAKASNLPASMGGHRSNDSPAYTTARASSACLLQRMDAAKKPFDVSTLPVHSLVECAKDVCGEWIAPAHLDRDFIFDRLGKQVNRLVVVLQLDNQPFASLLGC